MTRDIEKHTNKQIKHKKKHQEAIFADVSGSLSMASP